MSEALELLKTLKTNSDSIYIYGPVGSGKTHLAVAVAQRFAAPLVVKPTNILRELRAATAAKEIDVLREYIEAQLLVIDDIGIQKDTEFATTALYEVIDGRYAEKRGGLIVTSNLSIGALSEKIGDDRITSRLAQMCRIISLDGEKDHRLERR